MSWYNSYTPPPLLETGENMLKAHLIEEKLSKYTKLKFRQIVLLIFKQAIWRTEHAEKR